MVKLSKLRVESGCVLMSKEILEKTRSKIQDALSKEPQTLSQIQKSCECNYNSIKEVVMSEVDAGRATPIGKNRVRKASFFERIKNRLLRMR